MAKDIKLWNEIEEDTIELAKQIEAHNISYKGIVVISRGGLGVAALLSRLLDIKLIDVMCLESYTEDRNRASLKVIKEPSLAIQDNGEGWLVVDDLLDSGATLDYSSKILPKAIFCCLYNKNESYQRGEKLIFTKNQPAESWIEFPWESIVDSQ